MKKEALLRVVGRLLRMPCVRKNRRNWQQQQHTELSRVLLLCQRGVGAVMMLVGCWGGFSNTDTEWSAAAREDNAVHLLFAANRGVGDNECGPQNSVAVLSETSLRSLRKLFIFIIKKKNTG